MITDTQTAILWPIVTPQPITEMQHAHDFCLTESRRLCSALNGVQWLEYDPDQPLGQVLERSVADAFLLVSDPLIVLNTWALEALLDAIGSGQYAACGPVYNDTKFPDQQATLDLIYQDISTYQEVAWLRSEKAASPVTVAELDPGCVLYAGQHLRNLGKALTPNSLAQLEHLVKGAVPGALIHRFSTESTFGSAREELIDLVPSGISRVMDIGCGMGGYGRRLKQIMPEIFVVGVESNPLLAAAARPYYDIMRVGPAESAELEGKVDLINCGDFLEHLYDPWAMLNRINRLLDDDGYLVLSIPNTSHWSVVQELLEGRFQYLPSGIKCIGHIRWFTEMEICEALDRSGFEIDILKRLEPPPTPRGEAFIQMLLDNGCGDRTRLTTTEIVIRARKK